MTKKYLSQQNYDHLIDSFAQQLWFIRERWVGIKALRTANHSYFDTTWTLYHRFFDSVYRTFIHDFYIGICRLTIDDSKEVESMVKLLKKQSSHKPAVGSRTKQLNLEDKELLKQILNNPTLIKIKN